MTPISRIGKFIETESRTEVTRSWSKGKMGLLFNRDRVSVGEDEKVMEMDSDEDRAKLRMYLMPRNYT